ncbi:MAG: hypothetical protein R3A12_19385 [Ignavibacteria bacterium]|nr:hypothetical protein [Ignavibacteriota bacterium]
MKNFTTSKIAKFIATFLIVSCFIIFNAECFSQQQDAWEDKSGELDYGSDNTWLYVGLGVLAAGAIVYFLITSSSDDESSDKDSSEKEKKENESGGYFNIETDSSGVIKLDSAYLKKLIDNK